MFTQSFKQQENDGGAANGAVSTMELQKEGNQAKADNDYAS